MSWQKFFTYKNRLVAVTENQIALVLSPNQFYVHLLICTQMKSDSKVTYIEHYLVLSYSNFGSFTCTGNTAALKAKFFGYDYR